MLVGMNEKIVDDEEDAKGDRVPCLALVMWHTNTICIIFDGNRLETSDVWFSSVFLTLIESTILRTYCRDQIGKIQLIQLAPNNTK